MEVTVSIFLVVSIVLMSKSLMESATDRTDSINDITSVESKLSEIKNVIVADLSGIVLLEKNQPIFEIRNDDDAAGDRCMCFFTTNSKSNITVAVKYLAHRNGDGTFTFSRSEISPSDTLDMQTKISGKMTLMPYFEKKQCSTKKYSIALTSFSIRPTIAGRTATGNATFPKCDKIYYMNGMLFYKNDRLSKSVCGDISFFDVTVAAITKSDFFEVSRMLKSHNGNVDKFINERSRKAFAKIVPFTKNF